MPLPFGRKPLAFAAFAVIALVVVREIREKGNEANTMPAPRTYSGPMPVVPVLGIRG